MEETDDDIMALFQEGREDQKSRKRKLDKDGFVCPTTPDIPKTSHQFVQNGHQGNFNGVDTVSEFSSFGGEFIQTDSESVSSYFKAGVDDKPFQITGDRTTYQVEADSPPFETVTDNMSYNMNDNLSADTATLHDLSQSESVRQDSEGFETGEDNSSFQLETDDIQEQPGESTIEYGDDNMQYEVEANKLTYQTQSDLPNEEGAATQERTDNLLQSLLKGFEQESSALFDHWSNIFRECGEYELLCQQKLDGMIQDARSIEDSLNSKKDVLCNRLKGIGKSLETC